MPRNWLVLANFNILGIFPTQLRSQSLVLNSEFQNSNFSEILPRFFLKIGNFPEFAIFGQFQHIGHFFHSILVTEVDFKLRISNFKNFLELFQNFLELWKFWGTCQFWLISTYWASFPLNFSHWVQFNSQNFKNSYNYPDILWKSLHLEIGNSLKFASSAQL